MWKQLKCPSADKYVNKTWYICAVGYYSFTKRSEILYMLQHA